MELQPHPDSPCSPANAIHVRAVRPGDDKLSLLFTVDGDIRAIFVPEKGSAQRTDGLWRHSCFEAFIRSPGRQGYVELNLSPSGAWAAYRFDDYRAGMQSAEIAPPTIKVQKDNAHLGLVAEVDLASIAELNGPDPWQLALSAVIETQDGSLSHWALAHPQGAADFHHPDCFVLDLPPAGEP